MRLGVIADTRHFYDSDGRLCTLEPVAAQFEQWAALFDEVVLLVPLWPGPPPPGFRPYRLGNVSLLPVRPAGGPSVRDKVILAMRIPSWTAGIVQLIRRVDALYLRTPCNIGLLGTAAASISRCHRAAMYVGSWHGYAGEPLSYRAQRWLLARPGFGGPVTVYTSEAAPAEHVVPFFSPTFTRDEWEAERTNVEAKAFTPPYRLVTVGHLVDNKDHATVLDAVARLRSDSIDARLDVVGDGPLRRSLEDRGRRLGLEEAVAFHGRLPLDAVRECYRRAHFNVLASRTEGYPKVVVEGMACGAVPVTTRFPTSGELLDNGRRGATFAHGDSAALADAVAALVNGPDRATAMAAAGYAYAGTVTLDHFGERMRGLLERSWGVPLPMGVSRP